MYVRVYVCTYKEQRADDEFLRSTIRTNICSCNRERYYVRGASLERRGWQCVILAVTRLYCDPTSFIRFVPSKKMEGRIPPPYYRAALAGTLCSKINGYREIYPPLFLLDSFRGTREWLASAATSETSPRLRIQGSFSCNMPFRYDNFN